MKNKLAVFNLDELVYEAFMSHVFDSFEFLNFPTESFEEILTESLTFTYFDQDINITEIWDDNIFRFEFSPYAHLTLEYKDEDGFIFEEVKDDLDLIFLMEYRDGEVLLRGIKL